MSFSQDVKTQICSDEMGHKCCVKSFLTGVMAPKACADGDLIRINIYGAAAADYVGRAVTDCYGKAPVLQKDKSSGVARTLVFSSSGALRLLDDMDGAAPAEEILKFRCPSCKRSFLRGLFLACGRVSDPRKQYSLEFSAGDRADLIERFLWSCDLTPKYTARRRERILFLSDATSVEDFFVMSDLNQFAFTVMNSRIDHDMATQTVRTTNCEMSNLGRAVAAAFRQTEMIERLRDSGKLSLLPPELEETARVRLAHREMNLTSLAAVFTPPISKSGLAHRLDRIVRLAETLLEET